MGPVDTRASQLLLVEGVAAGPPVAGSWRNLAPRVRPSGFLPAIFLAFMLALPGALLGQQFQPINALHFMPTYPFDPLPQVLAVASTGADFAFSVSSSTNSGGSWLSTSPTGSTCCTTPRGVSVIVTTNLSMSGTYAGQVVLSASGVTSVTVDVILVITPENATIFDNMPGQVSFSMQPGSQPPSQVLQIRNVGTGTLNWILTSSTSNGGDWLSVSASSGTTPSTITVGITIAKLPGGGSTAGTYGGRLLIETPDASSIVSVPIGLTVSADAMEQVNALSFTKPVNGPNPLPQTVTIANGATLGFSVSAATSRGSVAAGSSWLSTSPTGSGCCEQPQSVTISVISDQFGLGAGTYTGQVLVDNGTQLMVIPATLTVAPVDTAFFNNLPGQLSFFLPTGATNPPPNQLVQILNAGTGSLSWTLTTTTFDSIPWVLAQPDLIDATQTSVGIVIANLPNGGTTAGVYTANLLFQSDNGSVTVPITVQIGPSYEQVNGLYFTMLQNGPNPLPQNVAIISTGVTKVFSVIYSTATGGNWLTVSPSGTDCCLTPTTLEVSVTAPASMPAGTYTAEIVLSRNSTALTVPVTLTVAAAANPYFDNLPGALSFTVPIGGGLPANQIFQIRNAGTGTLNWNLTSLTSDGGNWLTVSAASGTAPEFITVAIVPGSLPGGGLVEGYFGGQLLLRSGYSTVTIPVTVQVGKAVFGQINGLAFTMPQGGADPLPQVLTVTFIGGGAAPFSAYASTATGGNWLTISPSGTSCCETPRTVTVTVTADSTLAPGSYTGQILISSALSSLTVPVTLTVAAPNTGFFDNLPGAVSFSLVTGAGNPPSQIVPFGVGGTGTLTNIIPKVFTSDGAPWLTYNDEGSTLGVVTANLPGAGLAAGLYTGQVLLLSDNGTVTVPVSVSVGGKGFAQINPINFVMPKSGANPLPQILTATSIGSAAVDYSISAATASGFSWLTVSPSDSSCCATPDVLTVTVSAPAGLAAGFYTGQVIADAGASAMVIPVTLTVVEKGPPIFDNVQGQMSFFAAAAATPASQTMQIRGFGTGEFDWSVTPITADGGNWLIPSATTGTAPSNVSVSINPQNLPGQGLAAGQFTGQLLFVPNNKFGNLTVPVSVQLGPNIFTQMAGVSLSNPYAYSNPLTLGFSVTSTGTAFGTSNSYASGNGGNWLSVVPAGSACCTTPESITVSVDGTPGGTPVPPGIYTGQAVFIAPHSAMTVPVTLTVQPAPQWSISKTHTGSFLVGKNHATYQVTVSNQSGTNVAPTSGTATVTETVPSGMTLVSMVGTNWTCPAGNTCTRSDALDPGQSYEPITVTVDVASNAAASLTNQVSVSGGGSATATASDPTTIVQMLLSIASTHSGSFTQGQTGATYSVTVSNTAATGSTIGTVTVADTLPAGLTATAIGGTNWTCTLATLTCTRSDVLNPGQSYEPITVTVNVASNAAASLTNQVSVSGGTSVTANGSDPTTIIPLPVLSITSAHSGSFTQGQTGDTFSLTVSNSAAAGPTSGTVIVVDTLPGGLTATAIGGTNWNCTLATLTCTRSNVLNRGQSYDAITVTVNVASNAAASLTNQVSVSGGASATANASDPTTIIQLPVLSIASAHTGSFTQGQTSDTYNVTVSNAAAAGPTSGTVTVIDTLPAGLTATAIGGTNWSCTLATLTCTRSDALGAGASYLAITVTVNVASNAAPSLTNQVSVSGGGSAPANGSDRTTIIQLTMLNIAMPAHTAAASLKVRPGRLIRSR